jgi:2-(1,2-epoxy-1,2-dihydrophenyl)acetyl-CoA isomerase
MTEGPVTYRAAGGVAWITLNRPAVLNALNTDLAAALADRAEEAAADADVMAVVVAGAGRAFSGMDRTAMAGGLSATNSIDTGSAASTGWRTCRR